MGLAEYPKPNCSCHTCDMERSHMTRNVTFKKAVVEGSTEVFENWLAGLDVAELRQAQKSCSDWLCRANNPAKYPAMRPASVQALKPQVAARKGLIDARVAELVPREPGRIGMTPEEIAVVTDRNELFAIKNALQSTYSKRKWALESAEDMLASASESGKYSSAELAALEADVVKRRKLLDQVTPGKEAAVKAYAKHKKPACTQAAYEKIVLKAESAFKAKTKKGQQEQLAELLQLLKQQ